MSARGSVAVKMGRSIERRRGPVRAVVAQQHNKPKCLINYFSLRFTIAGNWHPDEFAGAVKKSLKFQHYIF